MNIAETKIWKFFKAPIDLIRRKPVENNNYDNSTQVSTTGEFDGINISRLENLVHNQLYNFDSKIIKFEQRKDIAIIKLPDLIENYRDISQESEIEEAISTIAEECIFPDSDGDIVEIDLNELSEKVSPTIVEKIRDSFNNVIMLLDFNNSAYKLFRDWYIDGRIVFEAVYDADNLSNGIQNIIQIDPIKIKKFFLTEQRKNVYEFEEVVYDGKNSNLTMGGTFTKTNINKSYYTKKTLLDDRFITYSTSGFFHKKLNTYVSYLHPALKEMGQLKMLEMSLLIYRLARAPERRVIYVDVNGMNNTKAEQYMNGIIAKFKSDPSFDDQGGLVINRANVMSATKDFYLPVRGGATGTRIESLPGAANLGELQDLDYFYTKLKKALRIPKSRWDTDSTYVLGESGQITQEEVKFSKFIKQLRLNFSQFILDLIKKDLFAKNIIADEDEWKNIKYFIKVDWNKSNYFDELMEQQIIKQRLDLINTMDPYVGKYFTYEDIFKDILKYNDERIAEVLKKNHLTIEDLAASDADAERVERTDDFDGDFSDSDFTEDFGEEDFEGEGEMPEEDFEGEGEIPEEESEPEEFSLEDLEDEEEI